MTQEDKQLLLKDLCARLPYGPIKVLHRGEVELITNIEYSGCFQVERYKAWFHQDTTSVKPYLRPLSSMTEEEKKEYDLISGQVKTFYGREAESRECANLTDWLNKNHFDYRGLIEKGLALEAPEGMYPIQL